MMGLGVGGGGRAGRRWEGRREGGGREWGRGEGVVCVPVFPQGVPFLLPKARHHSPSLATAA